MASTDAIAPALEPDRESGPAEKTRRRTLGNVRLRHHGTNEIILIPAPSDDPNDPLLWYVALRSPVCTAYQTHSVSRGHNGTSTTWPC